MSDLRATNPGLAESPTLELLLSDLRRQSEPGPTPTGPGDLGAWEPIVNAAVGSVYNPEQPSLVHRAANTVLGYENPPEERLDAAMPQGPGKGMPRFSLTGSNLPGQSSEAAARTLGWRAGIPFVTDEKTGLSIPVEPNPKPTTPRLSSLPELQSTVEELQGEMRPFSQSKKMYEKGTAFKKSLGETPGEATWYQSATNVQDLFRSPEDWDKLMRFYAATSPQQQSAAGNLDAAMKAFKLWKSGAPDEAYRSVFMGGHAGNVLRAVHGEPEMTGPKVFEFNRAVPSLRASMLAGDPEAVAFDRHNAAFYFPKLEEANLTPEHVNVGAARMREDARRVGTTPQEFAETVWRGYVVSKYGPNYAGAQALEPQIRARVASKGIENISDWAAKNGISTAMALYLIGAAATGAPVEQGAPQ